MSGDVPNETEALAIDSFHAAVDDDRVGASEGYTAGAACVGAGALGFVINPLLGMGILGVCATTGVAESARGGIEAESALRDYEAAHARYAEATRKVAEGERALLDEVDASTSRATLDLLFPPKKAKGKRRSTSPASCCGTLTSSAKRTTIAGRKVVRETDTHVCGPTRAEVSTGVKNVTVEGKAIAAVTRASSCGGKVVSGQSSVLVAMAEAKAEQGRAEWDMRRAGASLEVAGVRRNFGQALTFTAGAPLLLAPPYSAWGLYGMGTRFTALGAGLAGHHFSELSGMQRGARIDAEERPRPDALPSYADIYGDMYGARFDLAAAAVGGAVAARGITRGSKGGEFVGKRSRGNGTERNMGDLVWSDAEGAYVPKRSARRSLVVRRSTLPATRPETRPLAPVTPLFPEPVDPFEHLFAADVDPDEFVDMSPEAAAENLRRITQRTSENEAALRKAQKEADDRAFAWERAAETETSAHHGRPRRYGLKGRDTHEWELDNPHDTGRYTVDVRATELDRIHNDWVSRREGQLSRTDPRYDGDPRVRFEVRVQRVKAGPWADSVQRERAITEPLPKLLMRTHGLSADEATRTASAIQSQVTRNLRQLTLSRFWFEEAIDPVTNVPLMISGLEDPVVNLEARRRGETPTILVFVRQPVRVDVSLFDPPSAPSPDGARSARTPRGPATVLPFPQAGRGPSSTDTHGSSPKGFPSGGSAEGRTTGPQRACVGCSPTIGMIPQKAQLQQAKARGGDPAKPSEFSLALQKVDRRYREAVSRASRPMQYVVPEAWAAMSDGKPPDAIVIRHGGSNRALNHYYVGVRAGERVVFGERMQDSGGLVNIEDMLGSFAVGPELGGPIDIIRLRLPSADAAFRYVAEHRRGPRPLHLLAQMMDNCATYVRDVLTAGGLDVGPGRRFEWAFEEELQTPVPGSGFRAKADASNCVACGTSGTPKASDLLAEGDRKGLFAPDTSVLRDALSAHPKRIPSRQDDYAVRTNEGRTSYLKIPRRAGTRLSRENMDELGALAANTLEDMRRTNQRLERFLPRTEHLGGGLLRQEGLAGVPYAEMRRQANKGERFRAEALAHSYFGEVKRALGGGRTLTSERDPTVLIRISSDLDVTNVLFAKNPDNGLWEPVGSFDPIVVTAVKRPLHGDR